MTKEKLFGIIRHALTFGGGYLAGKCIVCTPDNIEAISSAVMLIVGVAWSYFEKKPKA